jgi:hypothetical protein
MMTTQVPAEMLNPGSPAIEAVATVDRGALTIAYTIRNSTSQSIYLFAMPRTRDGFDGTIVYVWDIGGGAALLVQGIVPIPPGLTQYTRPSVPGSVRLDPGGVHKGVVRAELPLQEWHPYAPISPNVTSRPVPVQRVRFVVQYILDTEKFYAEPFVNFPGVWQTNGSPRRLLGITLPLTHPIELRHRHDEFPRFSVEELAL